MAGNNSIQFLRGKENQEITSEKQLISGQPYISLKRNRLYIGGTITNDDSYSENINSIGYIGKLSEAGQSSKLQFQRPISTNDFYVYDDETMASGTEPKHYKYKYREYTDLEGNVALDIQPDVDDTAAFIRVNEHNGQLQLRNTNAGVVFGRFNQVKANYSFAMGTSNIVDRNVSSVIGMENLNKAPYSHIIGRNNKIYKSNDTAQDSYIFGYNNTNNCEASFVFGRSNSLPLGSYSYVLGYSNNISDSTRSFILSNYANIPNKISDCVGIGHQITLSGEFGVAIGRQAKALNSQAISLGTSTASGEYSVAIQNSASATGIYSVAIGHSATSSGLEAFATNTCTASGDYSVALGRSSKAISGSSVAIGSNNSSNGGYSVTLGNQNKTTGFASLAGGTNCESRSDGSIALGYGCISSNRSAFATGFYTKTNQINQFVMGQYNIGSSTNIFEIGNGVSDTDRSNLFEITIDGKVISDSAQLNSVEVLNPPSSDNDALRKVDLEDLSSDYQVLDATYFVVRGLRQINGKIENLYKSSLGDILKPIYQRELANHDSDYKIIFNNTVDGNNLSAADSILYNPYKKLFSSYSIKVGNYDLSGGDVSQTEYDGNILKFQNTCGFGVDSSEDIGYWRLWQINQEEGNQCCLCPSKDNAQDLGFSEHRIRNVYATNLISNSILLNGIELIAY